MLESNWQDIKDFADRFGEPIRWHLHNGSTEVRCGFLRAFISSNEQADFDSYTASYLSKKEDSDGVPFLKTKPLSDTDRLLFRGQGVTGQALKSTMDGETLLPTTTDIDFLVPEDRLINGTRVMLKNHHFDDYAQLMVYDLDNVLGFGAGVLLNHFAIDWNFVSDKEDQGFFILPYPAKLYAGLYVRLRYTAHNTAEDVKIKINYVLHKKQS